MRKKFSRAREDAEARQDVKGTQEMPISACVSQRRQSSLLAMTHMRQLHAHRHQSTDHAFKCGLFASVGKLGPSASARSKDAGRSERQTQHLVYVELM